MRFWKQQLLGDGKIDLDALGYLSPLYFLVPIVSEGYMTERPRLER